MDREAWGKDRWKDGLAAKDGGGNQWTATVAEGWHVGESLDFTDECEDKSQTPGAAAPLRA